MNDSTPQQAAYGTWSSPITAKMLVSGAAGISEVVPDGARLWWAESRPDEGGRIAIMCHEQQKTREITPSECNVRTTVHEYGGGAWWAQDGILWYVDYTDQRVRQLAPDTPPLILSEAPQSPRALRYADFRPTTCGRWLIGVCERHSANSTEPQNLLVAISTDGSLRQLDLVSGSDFYGSPCLSPDGKTLAWVQWEHPNMPWDNTSLHTAELEVSDTRVSVSHSQRVAGGGEQAIVQPRWSPDGVLHYLADTADLWHLYAVGKEDPVLQPEGEIGYPPWVQGLSRYDFTEDGSVIAAYFNGGIDHLDGYPQYTQFHSVRLSGSKLAFVSSSWSEEAAVHYDGDVVRAPRQLDLDPAYLAAPEVISFPTGSEGQDTAHALYYAPANPHYRAADGERPPLIVMAHGGPTSAARSQLSLALRFWTSRGFAVADVNYRGSSGFGRAYRNKLHGQWGIADVQDCVAVARYLSQRGDVDKDRLIIRGGSAGGFTVLCALAFHDTFTAGANMYGVADLAALANDTHKFESRYLDNLVGPWPEQAQTYAERSPINHLEGFTAPMIVLQGSEDAIVPPNQSRMIVDALDKRQVPVAYLEFEGEQHGFRQADSIITALRSELTFYGRVFGFKPNGETVDLHIRNHGDRIHGD